MKKILITAAALIASHFAAAQHRDSENIIQKLIWDDEKLSIFLDTRFDYQVTAPGHEDTESGFTANTIKVWIAGEIVPGVSYRLRQRLNRSHNPLRDNTSAATDHAWISVALGRDKNWSLTIGKQSVQFGTFEYDYNPADIYMSTMVNNDIDGYKLGINASYSFAGQRLNLQLINSDHPQFAAENYRNKAAGLAFLWEGSLWEGMVKTRWGYSVFMNTRTRYFNWVTPGTQLNIDRFTAELDYFFGYRNYNYGSVVGEADNFGNRYVRDQSLSLNLKYDFGKLRPEVKGIWDSRYDMDMSAPAYSRAGVEAALEYYPFTSRYLKDLRFHIMYSYTDTGFRGPYADLHNLGIHTALVGMRWLFKAK